MFVWCIKIKNLKGKRKSDKRGGRDLNVIHIQHIYDKNLSLRGPMLMVWLRKKVLIWMFVSQRSELWFSLQTQIWIDYTQYTEVDKDTENFTWVCETTSDKRQKNSSKQQRRFWSTIAAFCTTLPHVRLIILRHVPQGTPTLLPTTTTTLTVLYYFYYYFLRIIIRMKILTFFFIVFIFRVLFLWGSLFIGFIMIWAQRKWKAFL